MIKIELDMRAAQRAIVAVERQMPYATSVALNSTAFDVRDAHTQEIARVFHTPVPFVRRAPKVEKASKRRLLASVYIDPRVEEALAHHVAGGARLPRDVARVLRGLGVLRGGEYTTYAPGYTNAAGNLTRARWTKILDALRKRGSTQPYFAATIRGTKAIWIRKGRGAKKVAPVVYIVGAAPVYRRRFDFHGIGHRVAGSRFAAHFDRALDRAMSGAR